MYIDKERLFAFARLSNVKIDITFDPMGRFYLTMSRNGQSMTTNLNGLDIENDLDQILRNTEERLYRIMNGYGGGY